MNVAATGRVPGMGWLDRLPWWLFAALCAAAGVASFIVVYVIGNGFRIGGL